ncbi:hypothetical protein EsDP_00000608 [Epichloe bromicola]|uniref:Uncharacterized protein n=1 Tax=Epichloe bromicola TaxID=79588 RepID=A0ABQ0CFG1_9HYPO
MMSQQRSKNPPAPHPKLESNQIPFTQAGLARLAFSFLAPSHLNRRFQFILFRSFSGAIRAVFAAGSTALTLEAKVSPWRTWDFSSGIASLSAGGDPAPEEFMTTDPAASLGVVLVPEGCAETVAAKACVSGNGRIERIGQVTYHGSTRSRIA